MSFLKKSLEKRIQELHASIEAQKTELAAYEQVLALESGKTVEGAAPAPAPPAAVVTHTPVRPSDSPVTVEFNGSRSDFVVSILKERGSAGITPSEIAAAFAARKVAVSKNLVYNVLSLLYKGKKVRKSAGRYFPASPKAAVPVVAKKKRRISEEGMRRIIAATKKRWALQRAAKAKGR
jgi:hypothetical protein